MTENRPTTTDAGVAAPSDEFSQSAGPKDLGDRVAAGLGVNGG